MFREVPSQQEGHDERHQIEIIDRDNQKHGVPLLRGKDDFQKPKEVLLATMFLRRQKVRSSIVGQDGNRPFRDGQAEQQG